MLSLLSAVAVLGCSTTVPSVDNRPYAETRRFTFQWDGSAAQRAEVDSYANVLNLLEGPNPILALYREDITHQAVVNFFIGLTGSPTVALPILYHTDRTDLSVSLVFALSYVESRYSPTAVNRNATSIDRGLFQLNSLTFRDLTDADFFDPDVNTQHGVDYLVWCLRHTNNERQALAAYNAGLTRARNGQIPASTRVYIERVMTFKGQLERRFRDHMAQQFPVIAGL